jgi:PIN domain nuclease of toxin-antitoxin system
MTALAVVDAHALLWAATGKPRLLGRAARKFFEAVEEGRAAAYVPTMALVEIGEASARGSITLTGGFERWTRGLVSSGKYHPVDLTVPIVLRAQSLCMIPERRDRLVAATALELNVPVISKDAAIAAAPGIQVVW